MKKLFKFMIEIIIVLLVFLSIIEITYVLMKDENGVTHIGSYIPIPIKDDTMEPTINMNDLIIDKKVSTPTKIKENDIINYFVIQGGNKEIKTGRVISVVNSNGTIAWKVRGDNQGESSVTTVLSNDLIGQFTNTKMLFAGAILSFAESQNGFIICIVVPLGLLFVIQIFKLIHTLIVNKKKTNEEVNLEDEKKSEMSSSQNTQTTQPKQTTQTKIVEDDKNELAAPIVVSEPIYKNQDQPIENQNSNNKDVIPPLPTVDTSEQNEEEKNIEQPEKTSHIEENHLPNFSEPKVESIPILPENISQSDNGSQTSEKIEQNTTNTKNTVINKQQKDDEIEIL